MNLMVLIAKFKNVEEKHGLHRNVHSRWGVFRMHAIRVVRTVTVLQLYSTPDKFNRTLYKYV